MQKNEVSIKVIDILAGMLGISKEEVKPGSNIKDDLGADSLDTVDIIMEFENEFKIQIPDDNAQKITTVEEAVNFITEKLN